MKTKKHKRKKNHVVIVTSDAVDASVRQYRFRPGIVRLFVLTVCLLLGGGSGYLIYGARTWKTTVQRTNIQQEKIEEQNAELEKQNTELVEVKNTLEAEIENLKSQNELLSKTVNQKKQTEEELSGKLEEQMTPTEFPLTGSATMEEVQEGDPMCIFTADAGATVVATAGGTVMYIQDDAEYGHSLCIDHGNGYVTLYRNQGNATVEAGDEVVQGTTLFVVGSDNTILGYQMMKDGMYIIPTDIMTISG